MGITAAGAATAAEIAGGVAAVGGTAYSIAKGSGSAKAPILPPAPPPAAAPATMASPQVAATAAARRSKAAAAAAAGAIPDLLTQQAPGAKANLLGPQ